MLSNTLLYKWYPKLVSFLAIKWLVASIHINVNYLISCNPSYLQVSSTKCLAVLDIGDRALNLCQNGASDHRTLSHNNNNPWIKILETWMAPNTDSIFVMSCSVPLFRVMYLLLAISIYSLWFWRPYLFVFCLGQWIWCSLGSGSVNWNYKQEWFSVCIT